MTSGTGGTAVEDPPEAEAGQSTPKRGGATATGVRLWLAAAVTSLGLQVWWVLQKPFVGLADNGDWDRYSCPLALNGQVRFTSVPATLAREHCLAYDYRSTFTPFLWAFAKVDTFASGSVHLFHLALFWAVVVSIGWGWFAFELHRATGKPALSFVATTSLIVVSSDIIFTSYFGSIYAEALVIALLPALAAALVRVVRSERLDAATIAGTAALLTIVTCSKPSMTMTAPLFVAVVLIARRGSLDGVRVAAACIAALGVALFSATAIADPALTSWNTYNLAFTVVAPESDNPQATLEGMGIDPADAQALQQFVGVEFGPEVTEAWDEAPLVAFRHAGRTKVIEALAKNPRTWVRMVHRGGSTMSDLRLDYLANHTGTDDTRSPRLAHRPHPADAILDPVAAAWWLLPVAWIGLAIWFGRRLWSKQSDRSVRAVSALGLFAVAFAALQTVTSLGDGYYELAKHLAIAGEATALTVTGLLVFGGWTLAERLRTRV